MLTRKQSEHIDYGIARERHPPLPHLHRIDTGENNPAFMASRPRKAPASRRSRPVAMPPARGCSKETAVDKAYLEDLAPGQVFTSDARTVVDADAIKRFG